jgi:hypothetical protein
MRHVRPHATARLINAWAPVVFAGGRQLPGSVPQAADAPVGVAPRRRSTRPGAVIGAEPPDFCSWLFVLLGALPGDTLEDLYPGSGIVIPRRPPRPYELGTDSASCFRSG